MAGPYQKLLRKKLDLSSLGLAQHGDFSVVSCTPKSAKIIGWAQTDDIHFCFIRGFGETVFSIDPSAPSGNCIHPVARDFTDFLRLILACGSTLPLVNVWQLTEEEFSDLLWAQLPSQTQQRALDALQATFELSPMEQPYIYLRGLQSGFDYSRILYSDEENSISGSSRWRVCFPGHEGNRSRSGEELLVAKEFTLNGIYYYIPSIYLCSAGLIVDVCSRASGLSGEAFSAADGSEISLVPIANGKHLFTQSSTSEFWDPGMTGREMPAALAHYSLDSSQAWRITRFAFPWVTKRRPILKSFILNVHESTGAAHTSSFSRSGTTPDFSFVLF